MTILTSKKAHKWPLYLISFFFPKFPSLKVLELRLQLIFFIIIFGAVKGLKIWLKWTQIFLEALIKNPAPFVSQEFSPLKSKQINVKE